MAFTIYKYKTMKISISFLLAAMFLFGCATPSQKKDSDVKNDIDAQRQPDVPKWVYSAQASCPKTLLCASSSGDNQQAADINAKKSLASIFETKIKSRFEIEQHDYSADEVEQMVERVQDFVSESVDSVLNGVIIKDRHFADDLYFSLAALDKFKAAKILQTQISQLDDQMDFLFNKGKKSSIFKLHMLLDQREMLAQKLLIITGRENQSDYSFSKINALKYSPRKMQRIVIKAVNDVPRTMLKWMESLFTQLGYRVIKDSDSDYLIKVKYFVKELYLKVRGFKKFSFSIVVESKNNAGEKLGISQSEFVSTGRNQQDAFLKVKTKLQDSFKEKIDQLNLE